MTPGNWSRGKEGGSVVSDRPHPQFPTSLETSEYYGGQVICESAHDDDAAAIVALPDLLSIAARVSTLDRSSSDFDIALSLIVVDARRALKKSGTSQ